MSVPTRVTTNSWASSPTPRQSTFFSFWSPHLHFILSILCKTLSFQWRPSCWEPQPLLLQFQVLMHPSFGDLVALLLSEPDRALPPQFCFGVCQWNVFNPLMPWLQPLLLGNVQIFLLNLFINAVFTRFWIMSICYFCWYLLDLLGCVGYWFSKYLVTSHDLYNVARVLSAFIHFFSNKFLSTFFKIWGCVILWFLELWCLVLGWQFS